MDNLFYIDHNIVYIHPILGVIIFSIITIVFGCMLILMTLEHYSSQTHIAGILLIVAGVLPAFAALGLGNL